MNVLLIGSGGREHALAWALSASPIVDRIVLRARKAGIEAEAECVAIDIADLGGGRFRQREEIGFVVVGPEAPLVAGPRRPISRRRGIKAFGPSAKAARAEGSKGFAKDLCRDHGIPTAAIAASASRCRPSLRQDAAGSPIVIKADGLAAGKGVVVAETNEEADAAIDMMFDGRFGAAGAEVVIEEYLDGGETSSSRCATANTHPARLARRTTSASSTATRGRTPAAWAPTRRRRS